MSLLRGVTLGLPLDTELLAAAARAWRDSAVAVKPLWSSGSSTTELPLPISGFERLSRVIQRHGWNIGGCRTAFTRAGRCRSAVNSRRRKSTRCWPLVPTPPARMPPPMDEEQLYRFAGLTDFRLPGHKSVAWRVAHGTQVTDLAGGYEQNDAPDERPIVCVQLPIRVTADTSGGTLSPCAFRL